jgi:hypothetical protein
MPSASPLQHSAHRAISRRRLSHASPRRYTHSVAQATGGIDRLLFGLHGATACLTNVGHSRVYDNAAEIAKLLEPLKGGTGLTGRAPGGKSRWTGKSRKMVRLKPVLVAELSTDHISGGQFRHGSRLLRWRPKAPEDCTRDQIQ